MQIIRTFFYICRSHEIDAIPKAPYQEVSVQSIGKEIKFEKNIQNKTCS